jgi:hypothetical protein
MDRNLRGMKLIICSAARALVPDGVSYLPVYQRNDVITRLIYLSEG